MVCLIIILQHVRAKHGKYQEIKPDWSKAKCQETAAAAAGVTCQQGEEASSSAASVQAAGDLFFKGVDRINGGLSQEEAKEKGKQAGEGLDGRLVLTHALASLFLPPNCHQGLLYVQYVTITSLHPPLI